MQIPKKPLNKHGIATKTKKIFWFNMQVSPSYKFFDTVNYIACLIGNKSLSMGQLETLLFASSYI